MEETVHGGQCPQLRARVSTLAANLDARLNLRFQAQLITVSSFTAPRTIDRFPKKPLTLDEMPLHSGKFWSARSPSYVRNHKSRLKLPRFSTI